MPLQFGNQQSLAGCQLADDGFEIVDDVLSQAECDVLANELTLLQHLESASAKGKLGGLRNLLRNVPQIAELASSSRIKRIFETRLGRNVFPVRALFFDKTPQTNWFVAWHQDLSIAVAEKTETDGYQTWSVKEGVVHVQPPREILEGMVTLRLHLDDCMADNGALKVVPRSHLRGKLRAAEISSNESNENARVCEVSKGGALLMRPLLLHSSSAARTPSHRRVLHIEYAADELANGLKWFTW